jgi:undecaprenyl-diphosphatase
VGLGALQGATEFLPVSSSGHLALVGKLVHVSEADMETFGVFVHFGTLIALLVYYWRDFWAMLQGVFVWRGETAAVSAGSRRLLWFVLLATIPGAAAGVLFEKTAKAGFGSPVTVGAGLLITATLLAIVQRLDNRLELGQMRWWHALIVGLAQAASAVFRGLSRMGSTVSTGMMLGFSREWAPRFAFLLSAPIIFGSCLVEGKHLAEGGIGVGLAAPCLVGVVVSAIVGYAAIRLLVNVVRRGSLVYFSVYCAVVGLAALIAGLAGW